MKNIGKKIRDARKEIGMKQKIFASKIGVKKSTVSNWERGRNGVNNINRIIQIAEITGKPLHYFLSTFGIEKYYEPQEKKP